MKNFFVGLLVLFAAAAGLTLQAQDKIVTRTGRTIEVKIQHNFSDRVEYTYPGETTIYERPKSSISYIIHENGRKEICDESLRSSSSSRSSSGSSARSSQQSGSRISSGDEVYWQDVKTTFSEAEVSGMKRLGRVSAVAGKYKDALSQLKKKAAALGGTTILIMDIPEGRNSDDVEVMGIAYRDENLRYTPPTAKERTETPRETPANERRRRIAQHMQAYNTESNIRIDETPTQTTRPSSGSGTTRPSDNSRSSERSSVRSSERQNLDAPDAVYLTNGRVIEGTIEEFEPDDFVSIRTAAGKVHEFSMDDVKRISRSSAANARSNRSTRSYEEDERYASRRNERIYEDERGYGNSSASGYKGIVDLGYNIPILGTAERGMFDVNTSHGYQINEYLFIGVGLGLHTYFARNPDLHKNMSKELFPQYAPDYNKNSGKVTNITSNEFVDDSVVWRHAIDTSYFTLPLFLDVRGYLPIENSFVTPFAMLRVGYAFNLTDGFNGQGLYLNPAVGVKFDLSPNFGLNVTLGYTYQSYGGIPKDGGYGYYYFKNASEKDKDFFIIPYEAKAAQTLSLKVGIEF